MAIKPLKIILWAVGGTALALAVVMIAGSLIARSWSRLPAPVPDGEKNAVAAPAGDPVKALEAKNRSLNAKMKALAPRGVYIMIDTAENRLRLMKDGKMIREAVVSCGSGSVLQDPKGEKKWIFDTPRGEFSVSSKLVNPTWIKPDWAFYEEGEPLPKDFSDRVDNDTLGDYALGFGNGFFIHGTLYTRMLGRNVTHGCVRVGDDDLKEIYKSVPFGAKVYIY